MEAALEMIDGPTELAVDLVPTVDQAEPAATYADWRPEGTRVIACRIANDLYRDPRRYESREEALRALTAEFGPPVEVNAVPGRLFVRVRKKRVS